MIETFDIESARRTYSQRRCIRNNKLQANARQAQQDFDHIIQMLIKHFSPRRIYQWGSLLHPDRFQEISDIDIAIEGWTDPMTGLHALDKACQLTNFPVDLVELERIHPAHADTIRQEGKLVYEQTP